MQKIIKPGIFVCFIFFFLLTCQGKKEEEGNFEKAVAPTVADSRPSKQEFKNLPEFGDSFLNSGSFESYQDSLKKGFLPYKSSKDQAKRTITEDFKRVWKEMTEVCKKECKTNRSPGKKLTEIEIGKLLVLVEHPYDCEVFGFINGDKELPIYLDLGLECKTDSPLGLFGPMPGSAYRQYKRGDWLLVNLESLKGKPYYCRCFPAVVDLYTEKGTVRKINI